jgi:hypothetical protein
MEERKGLALTMLDRNQRQMTCFASRQGRRVGFGEVIEFWRMVGGLRAEGLWRCAILSGFTQAQRETERKTNLALQALDPLRSCL